MPECVEVMLMARALKDLMNNKLVTKFSKSSEKKMPECYEEFVSEFPMYCTNIETNGKLLWFEFCKNQGDTKKWYVFNNLGLYGGWMLNDNESVIEIEYKNSDTKNSNTSVFFKDSVYSLFRIFNTNDHTNEIKKVMSSRGIDVCKTNITVKDLELQLKRIKKPIEILQFLMKQDYLSGIGNFYKAEILYDAELSPYKKTSLITQDEKKRLCDSINKVIGDAIINNGRILKYSDLLGKNINQYDGRIYQKKQDNYGNEVLCENTSDGRKTYWVPNVQK